MSIARNEEQLNSFKSAEAFIDLLNKPRELIEKVRDLMNTLLWRESKNPWNIESVPAKISISDKNNLFNQYQLGHISKEELDAGLKALGQPKTQTVGNTLFTFEKQI